MQEERIISGSTEEEVWQQLAADLKNTDMLHYKALIEQGGKKVVLDIDIDLGGGFESGYATTTLLAPVPTAAGFKFVIYQQHFVDELGKFFGMQDIVIGYPEFDEKFIIKTNDEARVKNIFADMEMRKVLRSLPDFTFEITTTSGTADEKEPILQLYIEEAITEPSPLRKVYHAFRQVLTELEEAD